MITLGNLGERAIIDSVLKPRYGDKIQFYGDDCALVPGLPGVGAVVITTDPCPIPAALSLGFNDLYYYGWLLATINLSDLAAAGAVPVGVLSSLILPSELGLPAFLRLLDGLDDCCASAGTSVIGGNLKEGQSVQLAGTAIGYCDGRPLSRSGARAGDILAIVGDVGRFWAGYLATARGLPIRPEAREYLLTNVLTPQPQTAVGSALRRARCLSSCIDNSDGLYPSILGLRNGLGAELDFTWTRFDGRVLEVCDLLNIEPARLAFGWGDWQLIVTFASADRSTVLAVCDGLHTACTEIGVLTSTHDEIVMTHNGIQEPAPKVDSERFNRDSWFTAGLGSYIDSLLGTDLEI